MSHKTVYMGIPAEKLCGEFNPKKIASVVGEIMGRYVEETASEENIKCDWYEIGGRWSGAIGAIKGAENVLLTENGLFAYQLFDQYDVVINNGRRGPYFVDDVEYIPVSGGRKKDIAWDAISKLDKYKTFKYLELVLNRDPRLGGNLPEGYKIQDGDLYADTEGQLSLFLKEHETFNEWIKRLGMQLGRAMMSPDAYIDTNGVWHDDNDAWAAFEEKLMSGDFEDMPEDPEEASQQAYIESYEKFLNEELRDEDFFVILDCHCFP